MLEATLLEKTERFFFTAMRAGWASGKDGVPIPNFHSGWNEVRYGNIPEFRGYHLVDRWGIDPASEKPSGSTLITHYGVPAWVMWYGSKPYNKEVLPFLRKALMHNYSAGVFCGGRGPEIYTEEDLIYRNTCQGDFSRFSGAELIHERPPNSARFGSHEYWGGSLLYLKRN